MNLRAYVLHCTLCLSVVLTSENCFAAPAAGKEKTVASNIVQVNVDASFKPSSAIGLLLSSKGTQQKTVSKIDESDEGSYLVSFSVSDSEVLDDSMASAMVLSEDGSDVAFGDVKPVFKGAQEQSWKNVPLCPPEKRVIASSEGHYATIQMLVENRLSQRENLRRRLTQALDEQTLFTLRKFEKRLGLSSPDNELSPELGPIEMVDRLSREYAALKNFNSARKQAQESSAETNSSSTETPASGTTAQ